MIHINEIIKDLKRIRFFYEEYDRDGLSIDDCLDDLDSLIKYYEDLAKEG